MPKETLTFSEYLAGCRIREDIAARYVEIVERRLADFLRQWVEPGFGAVGDSAYGADFYEQARSRIQCNQECRSQLGEAFADYSQALKHVAEYQRQCKRLSDLGSTGRRRSKKPVELPQEPEEFPPEPDWHEGEAREQCGVRYERDPKARTACINFYRKAHDGRICCEACGLDFEQMYGELGRGFIEVHHLSLISQAGGMHEVNPATDLVPLCANCHAMIHRVISLEHIEGPEALLRLQEIIKNEK